MITKKLIVNQHKCEHCLYLLRKEENIEYGETHIKYICMLKKCIKEKTGDNNG